ncbi:alpha/beta-hydrolase [Coprinellus micaceus]|uniref:Alpha/beta-hydrolase n=1 Tax=Coprinellus micaceus TaxID=71717 RepID=A0A4Y7SMA0_COPMI|nr:alpha/beta-hydrolase [Coprinellus micaceus]
MSNQETPFNIAIPDSDLDLLKRKLELHRFPDELEDSEWDYGVPLPEMERLTKYWKDVYIPNKWREEEATLNRELPQFTKGIEVEGYGTLSIHYVHQKSKVVDAIPLLFVHGWPGNFLEARKILPLLVEASPDHPSFHVVALSLPGFGFSDGPKQKGFALPQYAEVCNKLMLSLGYNEYATQGGDWGSVITRENALRHGKKHVKAWHTNFPLGELPSLKRPLLLLSHFIFGHSAKETAGLARSKRFLEKGTGYFKEQATAPQTIGYSLADSPVGLLAWIYEKLATGTDEYKWTDDEVLTWISIYWFSKAGPTASARIYYEAMKASPKAFSSTVDTGIPTGYSYFPKEISQLPRSWLWVPSLVFESEQEKGGHFAAHEVPELLVRDLRKMFGKGSPAYGVVPGKTGYK